MAEERREPAIRVILMPRDTNSAGTIFGGVILSYIDQAGAVAARRLHDRKFVTVAMREVEFLSPVLVGDLVSFYADVTRVGRTSVTVRVTVEAHRDLPGTPRIQVTTAEVVYVAVGPDGRPVPVTP
jgi:acyl-CoA thioesterase YciA